jgi:ring-1,2-phenylacetyl-CoA epoxidase subunit PaaE
MSERYYHLKIKNIQPETPSAYSLILEQPNPSIAYKPGQFFTLLLTINGEKVRRSYSASSHPEEKEIVLTIKKVAGGLVSNYIPDHLKAGEFVEVMAAIGTFCSDKRTKDRVLLVAGGSGITPIVSILKDYLKKGNISKLLLVDCNRSEEEIIFHQQLEALAVQHANQFKILHYLSQPTKEGVIPAKLSPSSLKETLIQQGWFAGKFDAFVCGPNGMMENTIEALKSMEVADELIHKESFFNAAPAFESISDADAAPVKGEDTVTIVYAGSEYVIDVPKNKSILEAALDLDIDLPYSCQSGLCTACMGKCTSGKVTMPSDADGLSDKEIKQGYVLTCVGRPVAPNTVIEID